MAAKSKGTATGYNDAEMNPICIGDTVTDGRGDRYVVNRYGHFHNDEKGDRKYRDLTFPVLILKEDREQKPYNPDCIPPVELALDPKHEEEQEMKPEESCRLAVMEKELKERIHHLTMATDDELLTELRRRGFSGNLRKRVVSYESYKLPENE